MIIDGYREFEKGMTVNSTGSQPCGLGASDFWF